MHANNEVGTIQPIAEIANIAKEHGIEPASPDEARQILNLKGLDKVKY